jgi:hypothetical protein
MSLNGQCIGYFVKNIISTQIYTFLNTLWPFFWKEEDRIGLRDYHIGLLFFRDPGCGKKTGRGVIWVEKRCFKLASQINEIIKI